MRILVVSECRYPTFDDQLVLDHDAWQRVLDAAAAYGWPGDGRVPETGHSYLDAHDAQELVRCFDQAVDGSTCRLSYEADSPADRAAAETSPEPKRHHGLPASQELSRVVGNGGLEISRTL